MPKTRIIEKKHPTKTPHKKSAAHTSNGVMNGLGHILNGKNRAIFSKKNIPTAVAIGAAAMGAAGAITYIAMHSKQKKKKGLFKTYQFLRDEAGEYAHNAYEKGKKAYDTASDYAESVKDVAHDVFEQPYSGSLLLTGIIGGTILGASTVYLLNHEDNEKHPSEFMSRLTDIVGSVKDAASSLMENQKPTDWMKTAKDLIDSLSHQFTSQHDEDEDDEEEGAASNIKNYLEWGLAGIRLWDSFKNRKS